jgi:hypothetical protein
VIGRASDIVGVWIEPVIAQLITILFAIRRFLSLRQTHKLLIDQLDECKVTFESANARLLRAGKSTDSSSSFPKYCGRWQKVGRLA